ncbi:MAG: beta strand repeat-containing protein [Planctomycetaceae bacterium]
MRSHCRVFSPLSRDAATALQTLAVATLLALGLTTDGFAQATAVSVSGTSYTQTFDSMTNSASAALPNGWSLFRSGTSTTPLTYSSGSNSTAVNQLYLSGTPTTGGAYLWAPTASGTDKSIGYLTSASYPGPATAFSPAGSQIAILFGFTNTTGATITNLDLGWNYERYREGARTQTFEFYSSADGSSWTSGTSGNLTFTGVSNSTIHSPPQQTAQALSIPSLSISNGSNYYLRWSWVTTGSWSNAQGVGLDDFTMNLTTSGSGSTDLYWAGGAGWNATAPGAGGSGSWANGSGSWDASQRANFGGTAGTVTAAVVTASNGLAFTTTGYTLTGGTITLAAASSGLNTITTGSDGTVTTTVNSALAGSAGMMKMGQGTLVLGGANTFTGGLTLSSGTLQISSDGNLGDAAGAVSLNGTLKTTANVSLGSGRAVSGGASLDIAPGTTLTSSGSFGMSSVTLSNSGTLDLQGATRSVGTLTFGTAAVVNGSGAISVAGITATAVTTGSAVVNPAITFTSNGDKTVDVGSGGTLALNGDIAGTTGRIAKTGAGTLVASGSNSTSGYRLGVSGASPTNGGTLILASAAASGTGQLQCNYGTLQATGPFTFANGLSFGGRAGAVAVLGGTNAMTFSGSTSFFRGTATSGELRVDVNNATTLAGIIGPTSGGGSATGITLGGTGSLAVNGDGSALADAITLQDTLTLLVGGTLGSGVTVGPTSVLGGDGSINGSLSFTSGADFLFDATKTLTVNGASVSFGGFSVTDLAGFSSLVSDGTYPLIDGLATINPANLGNVGAGNAYNLGAGRSAYFDLTAGLSLVVVPEPTSLLSTAALGLAAAVAAMRSRRS